MKKPLALAGAVVGVLCGVTSLAMAGARQSQEVLIIVSGARVQASGDLGAAHDSADSTQSIGCSVSVMGTSGYRTECEAVDAAGNVAECWSTDERYARLALAINGDSHVYFAYTQGGPGSDGHCYHLEVTQESTRDPKD
jgi:hypothetical protein